MVRRGLEDYQKDLKGIKHTSIIRGEIEAGLEELEGD